MTDNDKEATVYSGLTLLDLLSAQAPLSVQDLRAAIGKLERIRAAGPGHFEDFRSSVADAIKRQRTREAALSAAERECINELAVVLVEMFGIDAGRAQLAVKEHFFGSRRKVVEATLNAYAEMAGKIENERRRKRKLEAEVSGIITGRLAGKVK